METGGATFTRTALTIFVVLQVFAAKLLLQRFQDSGLIELPSWVPFFDKSNCGHQKAFEYVITSRNVITPDGILAAAGKHCSILMYLLIGVRRFIPLTRMGACRQAVSGSSFEALM